MFQNYYNILEPQSNLKLSEVTSSGARMQYVNEIGCLTKQITKHLRCDVFTIYCLPPGKLTWKREN